MKKLETKELHIKIIFVGMVLVLIAVLVPLFVIGHYNFESVDDFAFSENAEIVWEETHSVFSVFIKQIGFTLEYYKSWQGTYFGIWLMSTLLGIFAKNAYYVGTYLTLGSFVFSELFLIAVILRKVLKADIHSTAIVGIGCIVLQILLTPYPNEAFYWFNGAVLYTFLYSLAMLLTAMLISFYHSLKGSGKHIWQYIVIVLLTVAIAGGNYVTLITMLLIYFFATVWYWNRKNSNRRFVTVGMALYLVGFLLNVLAPGNQRRLSTADAADISAVKAILLSLKEAAFYVAGNTIFPCVILALLFLPLFVHIVKQRKYKYPFPVLVTLISFGVFAAQFTPTIYTLGITGAGRIQNLYRWTFYIWLYGNELYWTGWFLRRFDWLKKETGENSTDKSSYLLPGWIAGGLLLCFSLYVWGGDTLTTLSAVNSLRRGEAQTYYAEYQERLAVLKDDSVKEVRFRPYTYYPYLLYFGDITDNPEDWVNYTVATCYGKDSVVLIEE